MPALAKRLSVINESQTIMMARLSRELQAQGKDVINLSLGEPDFPTPTHIKEAAKKAIDDGYTTYPPISGYMDLRQAVSDKFKRENGLDFKPEQIVISTGAKQSIANVVFSLIDKDDEVIIAQPYWVSYVELVKLAEGTSVLVNAGIESEYKITPEHLEQAFTAKTKLFIFSSPCNPTGSLYTKTELAALAAIFEKHPNVYILSDEIYEHINFEGKHESIAQFESLKDRVIVVNGVSKAFAMTGWRIGYMGAPLEVAKACDKIQGQFTSAASSVAQRAALAALTSPLDSAMKMKEAFKKRRDLCLEAMKDIPGLKNHVPPGAFYVFPDISYYLGKSDGTTAIKTADDLCFYLLHNANVSIVTGNAFGAPNCVRISYAASEETLSKAFDRIKAALAKLN